MPNELPLGQVLIGDVRQLLADLPAASVDSVITSPPYWALRNYGHEGQIGTEPTVDAWTAEVAAVCDQLARVLTPTGALWLNLGDSFARHPRDGASKKSLLLAPQRVALRLTRSGWLLRNQVVWAKPNPMPSSATDRLTTTHEFLYFFTKQPSYYFDLDAIRVPAVTQPHKGRDGPVGYPPRSTAPILGRGTTSRINLNYGLAKLRAKGRESHPLGKNPGDVWSIGTGSYRGAHFATFPTELVRRPLLATTPERVCTVCGAPWRKARQMITGRALATGPPEPGCRHTTWRHGRVLDPFLGSGTVALAAEEHGRDWLGIELNPTYAALARERLDAWRSKQPRNRKEDN
ncbi:site-specific DNA-methyltransferase [Actinosynnema sp. NPDC051121]